MDYQNRRFSQNRNSYRNPTCNCNPPTERPSPCPNRELGPGPVIPSYDRYPVGMAYVPRQSFDNIYPIAKGFQMGTIFEELNLPFLCTPCRKGGC